jgi:hypothetical protein
MSAIPATNIASKIAPFDTNDIYETHDEKYGKGSYRTVADVTERDSITDARRKEGMLVYVIADDTIYQLRGGITNSDWRIFMSGPGGRTIFGTVPCNTTSYAYFVSNSRISPDANISVLLKIPAIDAVVYTTSVTELISGSFYIVLSDIPAVTGYSVQWTVHNPT